jgi:transcriptional regulator with XRE-family HTH domain
LYSITVCCIKEGRGQRTPVTPPAIDFSARGSDVGLRRDRSTGLQHLGSHLTDARLQRGLSQAELAARCALSQAQISYFELGRRRPTLDQLVRIAKSLDVSIGRLVAGADRPGDGSRDMAIELRHLGVVDLWVEDAVVPGAFRRAEEIIARAVSGSEPDPRILEAIPAVLAWNRINPVLLRAYGLTTKPRVTRRLAWLADVALAIDRRGGFPGGCRKEQLVRFTQMIPAPPAGSDAWDGLGRPMANAPTSPIWRRWRISYDADLAQFEQRARHLGELRGRSGSHPGRGLHRRDPVARRSGDVGIGESEQAGLEVTAELPPGFPGRSAPGQTTATGRRTSGGGRRDGT